jgi:hypothetical protein
LPDNGQILCLQGSCNFRRRGCSSIAHKHPSIANGRIFICPNWNSAEDAPDGFIIFINQDIRVAAEPCGFGLKLAQSHLDLSFLGEFPEPTLTGYGAKKALALGSRQAPSLSTWSKRLSGSGLMEV